MGSGCGLGPSYMSYTQTTPNGEREHPRDIWGCGTSGRGNGCKEPVSQTIIGGFTASKWQKLGAPRTKQP